MRDAVEKFAARERLDLCGGWKLRAVDVAEGAPASIGGAEFDATVPGCAHTDVLAAGVIEDPFVDRNEGAAAWVSETTWSYVRTFNVVRAFDSDRVDLVCDGLDTLAVIRVNGVEVGRSENMHVAYRFDVRDALRAGENEIEIVFEAALPAARRLAAEHGDLPIGPLGTNPMQPHNAIRKMACSYGWDWGPALPSVGVWRPIAIEAWSGARIASVRPLVRVAEPETALIEAFVDLERFGDDGVVVELALRDSDGAVAARASVDAGVGTTTVSADLSISRPRLWWPAGYGDQHLYTLDATVRRGSETLDAWSKSVGVRTVDLVNEPEPNAEDPKSELMYLRVNGRRVFCKGANWIPDDCFPTRITPERYRERVRQAADANMNMLRVWGGGIYESEVFYDACDRAGVMVWQDFLCACAAYHEKEPYWSWFEEEARQNVARLSRHASLVLWCGNNECVEAVEGWGEFESLREDPSIPWGKRLYNELFPTVVREVDPSRPYWPGSGHSTAEGDRAVNERTGDVHIWDVWNGGKSGFGYLRHRPKFASEFGFHGPPTWVAIEEAIPEGQRRFDSPAMVHHNRHAGGQALANTRMADFFDPPADFDDWLYAAQVVQARALEMGCEWFRALSPVCSGSLYWQLNDCWPVASWAAIDGMGRPKPLWFATRRFYRPRLATIRPTRPTELGAACDELSLYLHNDSNGGWGGEFSVEARSVLGDQKRALAEGVFEVEARGGRRFDMPRVALERDEFLVARAGHERAYWFPHPDREMPYTAAGIEWSLARTKRGLRLIGSCETLVRDLCVFADRLDPEAMVSDQLITALPGDTIEVSIRTDRDLTLGDLTSAPVCQSADRFGAGQAARSVR